jgi:hypothetical protein
MAIPNCQFIREIRQVISIRYANIRIVINFIKNTRIGILRIMHPFREGQLLKRLLIGIISGTDSHELRIRGTAPSHAQSLKHYPNILPALKTQ